MVNNFNDKRSANTSGKVLPSRIALTAHSRQDSPREECLPINKFFSLRFKAHNRTVEHCFRKPYSSFCEQVKCWARFSVITILNKFSINLYQNSSAALAVCVYYCCRFVYKENAADRRTLAYERWHISALSDVPRLFFSLLLPEIAAR